MLNHFRGIDLTLKCESFVLAEEGESVVERGSWELLATLLEVVIISAADSHPR